MSEGAGEVTELLRAWHGGDEDAYRRLSSILYGELHQQAARYMRRQAPGDTLQTTALVHEAFLRLVDANRVDWQDRNHFLAVAARTMRRVLVDLARARQTTKRGSGAIHVPVDAGIASVEPSSLDLVALDAALDALAAVDPRKAQVIDLRFFAGLTVDETAQVLQVSPDTVARDWRLARTWLLREMEQ